MTLKNTAIGAPERTTEWMLPREGRTGAAAKAEEGMGRQQWEQVVPKQVHEGRARHDEDKHVHEASGSRRDQTLVAPLSEGLAFTRETTCHRTAKATCR